MDEGREFADGDGRVALPVDGGSRIDLARCHRYDRIHLKVGGTLCIRGWRRLGHNVRVRLSELRLQISALQVHGQQVELRDCSERRTPILCPRDAAGCGSEQSRLLRRGSGELDVTNPDVDFLYVIIDCIQGAGRFFRIAQKIYAPRQLPFAEDGLQRLRNPVGKIAGNRQQLLEERNAALQRGAQFVVGEPDKVLEVRRHQLALIGVSELQGKFYAGV